jgi:arginine repressor
VAKKAKSAGGADTKVNKSALVREYLQTNKDAKPKEIVAALKEKGVDISPNMVSIIKAKAKVKRVKRKAKETKASGDSSTGAAAAGLDAAMTLYKAARGQEIAPAKVRAAFLTLVENFE